MSRVYKRASSPLWQAEWHDLAGRRHQRSTQCTDRRAAEARLREWERDSSDPARAAARETTIRTAVEAFVAQRHQEAIAGRKAHATVRFYAAKAGHAIRVFGEDFRLAELTPAALDRYISQRRGEGAGDGTIHKEGWTEAPSRPCAESHDRRRSARIGRVRWAFVKIVVRVLTLATATDNVLSVGGALDRGADGRTPRP